MTGRRSVGMSRRCCSYGIQSSSRERPRDWNWAASASSMVRRPARTTARPPPQRIEGRAQPIPSPSPSPAPPQYSHSWVSLALTLPATPVPPDPLARPYHLLTRTPPARTRPKDPRAGARSPAPQTPSAYNKTPKIPVLDTPATPRYDTRPKQFRGSNSVVECSLAKVDVASSNLVSRSKKPLESSKVPAAFSCAPHHAP